MSGAVMALSAALFIVWMQRHQRFYYFMEGISGSLTITGSRTTAPPSSGITSWLGPLVKGAIP